MNGSMFGTYVKIDGNVTEEKLAKAKEMLVEEVCEIIKEIAKKRDDFFIIKATDIGGSVAHKFILPTVDVGEGILSESEVQIVK